MTPPSIRPHPARRRGSVLLVALLFAAVIALSLGSFINLATQSSRLAYRGFYAGAAMNASETGLEQAMWSVQKRLAEDSGAWSGWETVGGAVRRTFTLPDLSGGASCKVKVFVSSANLVNNPYVIARSVITPKSGPAIERWIRISLSKRSRFSNGLVARDVIRFSGNNASVDSYDSRLGAYAANLGGGKTNKYDRGTAGSTSVEVNSLNLGNADIWGSAVIGSSDLSGINVGSQGTVGPFGTAQGTVNPDHVMTDFSANFDDVSTPSPNRSTNIVSVSGSTTLPRLLDLPASDGKYYYNINSISLSGNNQTLTIAGPVVIRMTPTTGTAINITGKGSIAIAANSILSIVTSPSLEIYTEADVKIAGNGLANTGKPETFKLWGTRSQTASTVQSLDVNGNGVLSGIVYAPHANISLHGGGSSGAVYGAIVGKTITVTGNSAFHYDEALADLDVNEPLGLDEWTELVEYADRTTYGERMNF